MLAQDVQIPRFKTMNLRIALAKGIEVIIFGTGAYVVYRNTEGYPVLGFLIAVTWFVAIDFITKRLTKNWGNRTDA